MTSTQATQLQAIYDTVVTGTGELKRISLPASGSIDVTQYTDKWAELNTSNFAVEFSVTAKATITAAHQYSNTASAKISAPTVSYDNSTGVLTITTSAVSKTTQCYSDNSTATSKLTATATPTISAVYMYIIE